MRFARKSALRSRDLIVRLIFRQQTFQQFYRTAYRLNWPGHQLIAGRSLEYHIPLAQSMSAKGLFTSPQRCPTLRRAGDPFQPRLNTLRTLPHRVATGPAFRPGALLAAVRADPQSRRILEVAGRLMEAGLIQSRKPPDSAAWRRFLHRAHEARCRWLPFLGP